MTLHTFCFKNRCDSLSIKTLPIDGVSLNIVPHQIPEERRRVLDKVTGSVREIASLMSSDHE